MREFLVAADDRTGALEVAGLAADAGAGPSRVVTDVSDLFAVQGRTIAVSVIDLDSRHLDAAGAASRASAVDVAAPAGVLGHKMDSTLRGNWHHEVLARALGAGRRLLVVPAFPLLGRTCVDGVVLSGGRPVADGPAGRDPLSPVRSSRPASFLSIVGGGEVEELRDAADVARWASGTGRVAVCDAGTDDDLVAIAAAWRPVAREVLFAGTGAALAAAIGSIVPAGPIEAKPRPSVPVLVVCGSLHPAARDQLDVLRTERPDIDIITSPEAADERGAMHVVAVLADQAVSHVRKGDHRTVLIIGGDTTAAVLGPAPVLVGGTLAPGVPWLHRVGGVGPLILTRSGGFGDERALVDLFEEDVPR